MSIWNPWKGCHKKSEGCKNCYIHRANKRKGIDTDIIYKTDEFPRLLAKDNKGNYKIKSGQIVYVCFNSDFLVEEADEWREEAWKMMIERNDVTFLFLTKRIERFMVGLPADWNDGYDHIIVGTTIENQQRADERLTVLKDMPIKHKIVTIQPMLERIDIEKYLQDGSIEQVVVGGESGSGVRVLNYDWVLDIREQCIRNHVDFEFRQVGSNFIKDGKQYSIKRQLLCAQARKANINLRWND